MKDMDKNFEVCQAISNYSQLLNLTLEHIVKHLNNMDKGIINTVSTIDIVGKYTIGGKTVDEMFNMLRKEFHKVASLTNSYLETINDTKKFVYVVTLTGKDVFSNWSIERVITHINELDKVRDIIRERYGVEFEKLSSRFCDGLWKFDNITDDRDIALIVERIDC